MVIVLLAMGTLFADHSLRQGSEASGQPGHVVINEVEHNPPGNDAGNEWVELYNPTGSEVSLGGWTLSTTAGKPTVLTLSGMIPPGGYLIVVYGAQWLENSNERVVLEDSGGTGIDSTPIQSDADDDGRCWGRYPNGESTWSFRQNTKGAPNEGEPVPESMFFLATVPLLLSSLRHSLPGMQD